jgi:hypothetical protein
MSEEVIFPSTEILVVPVRARDFGWMINIAIIQAIVAHDDPVRRIVPMF